MKKTVCILISLVHLLALSSCSTVEKARKIQRGEVPIHGERTVLFSETGLSTDKPVSLDELIAVALKYNPAVMQSSQRLKICQLDLRNAKAGYLPTLSSSAGHSRSTSNNDAHHTSWRMSGRYSGSIGAGITLYDFGKTSSRVKQAIEAVNQAQLDLLAVRNRVKLSVRQAFFEVHRCLRLKEVADASVAQYKEHWDQMIERRDVGVGTAYDCTKAEVDYHKSVLSQLSAENNLKIARANLNYALGLAENVEFQLSDGAMKEYTSNVDELMEIARSMEPHLASLRVAVLEAQYHVDEMIANLYPTLSLSLDLGLSGRNPGVPWLWNLSGGASIVENIFNGGRDMVAIEMSAAQLRVARGNYASAEQECYYNLQKSLLNMVLASRQLEVNKLTEKSAKENFDIVNEEFNVGRANSVERTDAQVDYFEAQAVTVSARYDYLAALAEIAYLIGE